MKLSCVGSWLAAFALAAPALAEETPVTVRVISQGAKFIGSSMGGVHVTLEDARTGEVLASGVTRGDTGDTKTIMKTPHPRRTPLSTEGAARFDATIDLDAPTYVRATVRGPLVQEQAANTVSATRWVLPGRGITGGDGWLFEMPGMVVDVLSPPAHVKLSGLPQTVEVAANVMMMCGCPIAPESPWPVDDFEIEAHVLRDGQPYREIMLDYAGTDSQFATDLTVEEPGLYTVTVTAHDKANGNAGVDYTTFIVSEEGS